MPAILTAEAIIFAINSALKLSHNIRRAYAHSIRARALALPLPDYSTDINLDRVIDFFDDFPQYREELVLLQELHRKAEDDSLSPEEKTAYYQYFNAFFAFHEKGEQGRQPEAAPEDLVNLFRIRQWEEGKEPASVLQLVAGSLVEMGIDFFLQTPGALNRESATGRIMFHFLNAFDEIDFADSPDIKKDFSGRLLPNLFAAGAEALAELSPEIAGDRKTQEFIKATAKGIANDIYRRAENMNAFQKEEAVQWGQVVLRSMISNAGAYVFKAPQDFFNTNRPMSDIIGQSGLLLLDAILDDDSDKVVFRKALSPETLDRMARATLDIVAEHPNLVSGKRGVKEIISGVAGAVGQEDFLRAGFLPELARIVLEQSAGSLPLLWRESPQGPEHLLVTALRETLQILSQKPSDAPWRPAFTKGNLLEVLEEVLEEVVANPAWVTDEVRGRPVLSEVMDATFSALNTIPKGERINAEILQWLIRRNLEVALTSRSMLDTVKWGGDQMEKTILQQALELVFSLVFPADTPPAVNRLSLLAELMDYVTGAILKQRPNEKGLILIDLILFSSGIDYSRGFNSQLADQLADAALQAMASRPELAAKPQALRTILAAVAGALDSASLKQPALLPRLVQLVLEKTAANAGLLIDASPDQPRHLLLTALTQILQALAASDGSGQWRPGISPAQAGLLIESLFDEVVRNPYWVTDKVNQDSLLAEVLDVTFLALAGIPAGQRLSPETIEQLIQLNLRTVASSPQVLKKVKWGGEQKEKGILLRALELVFAFTFPTDNTGTATGRAFLFMDLVDYVLEVLLSRHPDKKGLILVNLILSEENGIDYSGGFNEALASQLVDAALLALSENPGLVAHEEALQGIIRDIAMALAGSGLERPDLLPELIRLTLESTASHLHRLFGLEETPPRRLLVLALAQVLKALAQKPGDGKWKPSLSNGQILEIVELIFDAVMENPRWAEAEEQIFLLLEAIFRALECIPPAERLPYLVLRSIIDSALEAAGKQRKFMATIQTAEGPVQLRLQYSLETLFITLYDEKQDEEVSWQLSQGQIVSQIVDYFLMFAAGTPLNKKDVERARARINKALSVWKNDFTQTLEEVMENLDNNP